MEVEQYHKAIYDTLDYFIENKKVPHLLFYGENGSGKKKIVKDFLNNNYKSINNYKDYNGVHTHPQSIISGVFYVQVPEKSGELEFYHPVTDYLDMYWPQKDITEYNSWNSPVWRMPVKEGKLILFPSWLKHGVQPNLNKVESRISVSFNYN